MRVHSNLMQLSPSSCEIQCRTLTHLIRGETREGMRVHTTQSKQYCNQPAEDLGDAAVADLQYPGDVAGSRARVREFDDLLPSRVRKWPAADEDTPQLVHPAVPCERRRESTCNAAHRTRFPSLIAGGRATLGRTTTGINKLRDQQQHITNNNPSLLPPRLLVQGV